jgi:transcriptional regulator with XRE-family HTH domain
VITGQQIRAARELLGWTPYRLAPRAGIGHTLLRQFEAGARVPDERARELLGWRQAELAKRARIQAHSVESAASSLGQSFVPGQDMQAMRAVLEAAGVEFTNGDEPGVKLRRSGQGGLRSRDRSA